MTYTISQAAELAINCQDGCNASGIARTLSNILSNTLWPEALRLKHGTDWVNAHPIVYLFLYKLMALNGHEPIRDWEEYDKAERACRLLIGTEDRSEQEQLEVG